ncbi:hypothetical protein ACSLBF_17245 [Pseudoalteromonas sp. T1lg65]|uniref:hypothetical protein n=1 Tax=Pseudoalteromonas sp. T1lg65 TaxID=2077101 RepID=UPI003F79D6FB
MKEQYQDLHDVTEAKELLEKVEGGVSRGDVVAPCNWKLCPQPLYGVIIDPPLEY